MTLSTIATPERSMHHQNITAPRSTPPNTRKNGFLSTLASYLTSTAKSDPKPVTQRKPLITSWNDVDFVKLNSLVCNVLYDQNNYEPLITEIERVVGRRREHCFYGVLSVILVLVLLHDAIGAITAFMTLILPTFMTVTAISSTASYENPSFLKDHQDFFVRYWTVYAVFVTVESFLSSLIHWDLRLLRLIFMSMCLSARIPVLAATYTKILNAVSAIRQIIDNNNFEKAPPPQSVTILAVKTKTT
ncbi:hypothetical protein CRE_24934 [Caenorhabditis remanei]|uniref:Receptor expression-enhancing protein n=1 Tax=Caenorhabditis remanei TaxID=31234 RepID=E3MHT7_CAERE|nr:hypothetical protein CRE_24934 [Caenorhabditis remanei]